MLAEIVGQKQKQKHTPHHRNTLPESKEPVPYDESNTHTHFLRSGFAVQFVFWLTIAASLMCYPLCATSHPQKKKTTMICHSQKTVHIEEG